MFRLLAIRLTTFLNYICSHCPKITSDHKCTEEECNFCRDFNKKRDFICICNNCHFENGEEGIKTKTGNNESVILKASIIFFQFYL